MEVPVRALEQHLDAFSTLQATLELRRATGLPPDPRAPGTDPAFAALGHRESFSAVREAIARARTRKEPLRRLTLLLAWIANEAERRATHPAREQLAVLEGTRPLQVDQDTLFLTDILEALPREPHRERRSALERAAGDFLAEQTGPYKQRWESLFQLASAFGYPSYAALREAVGDGPVENAAADARALLEKTEAAYRDVVSYAFKKLEGGSKGISRRSAQRHDLTRAVTAPWLDGHYAREDFLPAAQRWLSEMGLDPLAGGHLKWDLQRRPGQDPQPRAIAVQVPEDVRFIAPPQGGLQSLEAFLAALADAQRWAQTSSTESPVARWGGDLAVHHGVRALFAQVLQHPLWHRRYLRLPVAAAGDGARLSAFAALASLRATCAEVPYAQALFERGPLPALAEAFQEGFGAALQVRVHRGFFLREVEARSGALQRLRGGALAARCEAFLQQRFNEDYWRNPAAGRWLLERFAAGGRESLEDWSKLLSGEPLLLPQSADHLLAALNR